MAVYKLLSFFILVTIVGYAQAQVIASGSCPSDICVVTNFNVSNYLGTWYEYAKYPNYFQGDGTCITAEYSLQSDGNVGVKNSQVNATTGETEEIIGYASVVSDGKLSVTFPIVSNIEVTSNYWVLDTDYNSYSVVYSCQSVSKFLRSTFVWILTRERTPTEATINYATGILQRNNISLGPLTVTDQNCCN